MIECPIPQDILKYKAKFVANLSTREAVCAAVGVAMALAGFFILFKDLNGLQLKIICSGVMALPAFIIGFVKPLGQPFEKIALVIIYDNFICPPRIYKEIRHPELEKFEKKRAWMIDNAADTQKKKKKQKDEIKVKSSKTHKGIR